MGNTDEVREDALDLADAIVLLRNQVAEAQRRLAVDGDKGVRFGVGQITLVLGLELARTRGVNGDLRFSLIGLGGKRESSRKATHEVTVLLDPMGPSGPIEVEDVM